MKKFLSLLALLLCVVTGVWAEEVYKFQLNGSNTEIINGVKSDAPTYFKWNSGKHNFNTKFKDCTYDGVAYKSGLKMEGATNVSFTSAGTSTVTIVQSTWSTNTIKFDETELAVADAAAITGGRVYTINDVAPGDHSITRGSGESGVFAITVTSIVDKVVKFTKPDTWSTVYVWAWNDEENFTGGVWPGVEVTETNGEGDYVWKTTGAPTKIIFSDNGSNQTADLDFKDGSKYTVEGRVVVLNDYTVTFESDGGWDPVYAYTWTGEELQLGAWPGTQMTKVSDGEWTVTVKAEEAPANIIFHNNADAKTPDLNFEDGKTYTYNLNTYTATFTTDAGWENVYAYAWNGDGEGAVKLVGDFPGLQLEATAGVYTFTYKAFAAPEKILFNNGNVGIQTLDMAFTDGRAYAWNTMPAAPLYAPNASEDKIPAGTTVDVKDAEGDVVATLTYGFEGGADFAAYILRPNEEFAAFQNYTGGNGENGSATSGTVYTIKPVYDGSITVAVWLNGGKSFFIQEDGASLAGFDGIKKSYGSSTGFTFDVKAGSTYKVYCTGSKLGFYGFDYKFDKPATVEIGSTEWATFSNAKAIDLTAVTGLTAYTVTGVSGETVEISPVSGIVPANTGLLLNGAADTYSIPTTSEAGAALGTNLLKAATGEVVGAIDGYTRYVLSEADGKAVFQCIWNDKEGTDVRPTIPVGKAYLEVPVGGGARTLYINAETTGINNVEHAGQFTFGTVYNMAGQRVSQPTRGLYIMNGKKVVVK